MTKKKRLQIPWAAGTLSTEYRKEYDEKKATQDPRFPKKGLPHKLVDSAATFKGCSTMKLDYQAWAASQMPNFQPKRRPMEDRNFNGESTYTAHYPPKEAPYAVEEKKALAEHINAPFYDETTNKLDYPGWGSKPRQPIKRIEKAIQGSVFEANSLYRDDFRKWESGRRDKIRFETDISLNLPLGASSTYRKDFPGHKGLPPERQGASPREQPNIPWAPGALETEYVGKYRDIEGEPNRIRSKKGGKDLVPSRADFKGVSTMKNDYVGWKGADRAKGMKRGDKPFKERPFDGSTTYNHEYVEKAGVIPGFDPNKNENTRRNQFDPNTRPFEGTSTTHTDYPGWDVAPPKAAKPVPRGIPYRPLEHGSLYRDDFKKWDVSRPTGRRRERLIPSVPFVEGTTYGADFTPKDIHEARTVLIGRCQDRPWMECESCSCASEDL